MTHLSWRLRYWQELQMSRSPRILVTLGDDSMSKESGAFAMPSSFRTTREHGIGARPGHVTYRGSRSPTWKSSWTPVLPS